MGRFWILLVAVAVVMVVALPAGAERPDFCADPNSTHPSCSDDDPTGDPVVVHDSCYAHGEWHKTPISGNFEVTLGGRDTEYPGGYCIDVMAEAGDWLVKIETTGKVQSLNLFLRDSVSAGDGCFTKDDGSSSCGYMFRTNNIPAEQAFIDIPGAWVNSCGTEWGEYVDSYWTNRTLVGDEWVGGEFHLGDWYDDEFEDIKSPLAFLPGIRAGSDATVVLTVYLPNDNSTPAPIELP